MARKSRRSNGRRTQSRSRSSSARATGRNGSQDAIALLKADHREVEGMFAELEKTNSDSRKQDLAERICNALKAHTIIEEEIFYPAFLEATDDKDIHHEAEVEHEGAKHLIGEIEAAGPDDDYFEARMSVLSEMIKHHVKEEEKRGGMLAKAKSSDMDLAALGEQMLKRKTEAMAQMDGAGMRSRMPRGARGRPMGAGRTGRGMQESARRH
jgi:hemerythrin superfamily protein